MTASRTPLLRVSVVRSGAGVVIRLDGELDLATADLVADKLAQLECQGVPEHIVVDAQRLTFIDASGLAPLLDAHQRLPPGTLRLRNVQPSVLRVLRLLALTELFGLD